MIWHFDHRYGTYEGATQAQLNVGTLPRPSVEQKTDPNFAVQSRYWVEAREVYLRCASLPPNLLKAIRDNNLDLITLGLAHLLFGRWLSQNGHAHSNKMFTAWCEFIQHYPFAREVAPTRLGLCGNNPPCLSPADSSYLPAAPVEQIKRTEPGATAWYAVDQNSMAEYLKFADAFPVDALKVDGYAAQDVITLADQLLESTTPK
jgi:hypothetical protein